MKEKNIVFGTSGHRGIIGKDFSAKHVQAMTLAIADFVKQNTRLVLGYDPRPGNSSELEKGSFTRIVADNLKAKGIEVEIFDHVAPTPLVSWYIKKYNLDGGIILTASHNPAKFNGLKFNPANGAPAPTKTTKYLEESANKYFDSFSEIHTEPEISAMLIDKDEEFATDLIKNCLNYGQFPNPDLSDLAVVIDAKHGTVGNIWEIILTQLGISKFNILHQEPLEDFGKIEANPTKYHTLNKLRAIQKELNAPFAFANDPDGDRHVILDENGSHLTPEETTTIILEYFLNQGIPVQAIGTTVVSSRLVKSVAEKNNISLIETQVGFKYFADFLGEAAKNDKIAFGVESSGGFTASFHTLEKCGFLPCLLILLISQSTKKTLSELKEEVLEKYGRSVFSETEYHFPAEKKQSIMGLFNDSDIAGAQKFFSKRIHSIVKVDGLKIVFDDQDWLAMRLSGTEPLARIYAESGEGQGAEELLGLGKSFIETNVG
ncbi:hypothetical protein ACFLZV_04830 [Candidatus Margulisiibacteriota bacterium]